MKTSSWASRLVAVALTLVALFGCQLPASNPRITPAARPAATTVQGRVTFAPEPGRRVQVALADLARGATVSLIDLATGNTVASSISDASGQFVLTFQDFSPQAGAGYILEAVKGLSLGTSPNHPGLPAVRVRTVLVWNGGWQSFTNTTVGVGITISPATTALAIAADLRRAAGATIQAGNLVGKLSGSSFTAAGTGLTVAGDFDPALTLVTSALSLDQDPVATVSRDATSGQYRLTTVVPKVTGLNPSPAVPGSNLVITGAGFDANPGRTQVWFGSTPAATWSLSTDGSTLTVPVPATAISGPLVLRQPGNTEQVLDPFLFVKGTVATFSGDGTAETIDGPRGRGKPGCLVGAAVDPSGYFVIATYLDGYIRTMDRFGYLKTLAGNGTQGFAEGSGSQVAFSRPYGVLPMPDGSILVADYGNHRIRRLQRDGSVTSFVGTGSNANTDGTGTAASIALPVGLARDAAGNVYTCSWNGKSIRKITPGGTISTFLSGIDGYQFPIDGTGNMYIGSPYTRQIHRVNLSNGSISAIAGTGASGVTDGPAASATFNEPVGMAIAPNGDLYISDYWRYRIRKLSGGVVSTVIGASGVAGNTDGPAGSATVWNVHQMAFDPTGKALFLFQAYGNAIRVYVP
ncbi:MAG: IPT/TIG domain-containing protein [bacterium]|nr:IPT/TIG domain-containing protein [bacterium]